MARIRTIKPEAFASESLAAVSLSAERTFFGLLTQADDHGRFRDQAAVISGLLWSLRPEHGPLGVEDDLAQLAVADLICRYQGGDGKRYLHIVTFRTHQKINRPSGVRHPACPHHDSTTRQAVPYGGLSETSVSLPVRPGEPSPSPSSWAQSPPCAETAGHQPAGENSDAIHGGLGEESVSPHRPDLGPRNRDLGSPPGGASAPAPATASEPVSAKQLVAEHVAACTRRPPQDVLALLGRKIRVLLEERFAPDDIRAALERLRAKGLHPSVLPSLVDEIVNTPAQKTAHVSASGAGARLNGQDAYRPYLNPAAPEPTTFGGRL